MARITVEDCKRNIKNRFYMILIASYKAKELMLENIGGKKDKDTVIALRQIADGDLDIKEIEEIIIKKQRKFSDEINHEYNKEQGNNRWRNDQGARGDNKFTKERDGARSYNNRNNDKGDKSERSYKKNKDNKDNRGNEYYNNKNNVEFNNDKLQQNNLEEDVAEMFNIETESDNNAFNQNDQKNIKVDNAEKYNKSKKNMPNASSANNDLDDDLDDDDKDFDIDSGINVNISTKSKDKKNIADDIIVSYEDIKSE